MDFDSLETSCERALHYTFCKMKLFVCAAALTFCGFLVIFSMGLSLSANAWVSQSLFFLPFFISSALLAALGIVLIRAYHHEIKNRSVSYGKIVLDSWEVALSSSYCFVPLVVAYLIMWVILGLFFLLREIPFIGEFFGVVLAFGPFLIHMGSFLLLALSCCMLFTLAPLFALRTFPKNFLIPYVLTASKNGIFQRLLFIFIAAIPIGSIGCLLWISAQMTSFVYFVQENHIQMILQWFFILPPFAVVLSFPVIFFFNMAAECHIAIQKKATARIES